MAKANSKNASTETEMDEIVDPSVHAMADEDFDTTPFEIATPDDGMQKVGRRQFYKYEFCKEAPVKGWLLKEVLLNPKTVGTIIDAKTGEIERENIAYAVELTHATYGYVKKDGRPMKYTAKAGSIIYLPANAGLSDFHDKLAQSPSRAFSIFLQPKEKVPHPKDSRKSVWRFDVRIGASVDLAAKFPAMVGEHRLAIAATPASPQLPQNSGPVYGGTEFAYGANAPRV